MFAPGSLILRVRGEADDAQDFVIGADDKAMVKQLLVPMMIALGTPATALLQAQVGEGLATIAEIDFPDQWNGLVDVSAALFSSCSIF